MKPEKPPYATHHGPHQWLEWVFSDGAIRRECTLCGEVQYGGDLINQNPLLYPTSHGAHDWRLTGLDPNGMYHRECRLCGLEEVSRDLSFSNTHQHIWNYYGVSERACDICGEFQTAGNSGWQKRSKGGYIQDEKEEVNSVGKSIMRLGSNSVADFGGIVAYNSGMSKVQFGDGSEMSVSKLLSANPGIAAIALTRALEDLPSRFYTPQQLADRIQRKAASAETSITDPSRVLQALRDSMDRMNKAATVASTSASTVTTTFRANQPLLSTDDAMALIVETVRNAGSPEETRKLAGQWLTRFTKEMSDILRELDRENE